MGVFAKRLNHHPVFLRQKREIPYQSLNNSLYKEHLHFKINTAMHLQFENKRRFGETISKFLLHEFFKKHKPITLKAIELYLLTSFFYKKQPF